MVIVTLQIIILLYFNLFSHLTLSFFSSIQLINHLPTTTQPTTTQPPQPTTTIVQHIKI